MCVCTQNLLPPNQDTTAILQISVVFIMECVLSNLRLVLDCKFGDLALKTKERVSGEEEEREREKKSVKLFSIRKYCFFGITVFHKSTVTLPTLKKSKSVSLFLFLL